MTPPGAATSAAPSLALDIGATKAEAGLVSREGVVLSRGRLSVRDAGDDLVGEVAQLIGRVDADGVADSIGVACAGPMTPDGDLVSPLNIPQWRDFPLREELERRTGRRVVIDGDVRALARAEGRFGSARRDEHFMSMVVSTGVGGAMFLDGRLLDGRTRNAGHVGHLTVVPGGRRCGCGARGCLEAEASGLAIEAVTGRAPADADAATRRRTAHLVGRAVGTLSVVLDFDRCYVGGSVALGFGDDFFTVANQSAAEVACMSFATGLQIHPTGLARDGALLGAALLTWETAA